MRINRKDLEELLDTIAQELKIPRTREDAEKAKKDKYLFLEHAPVYGGYRVVNIGVKNGAHYGAFGGNGTEARLKPYEMYIRLNSILDGINAVKHK